MADFGDTEGFGREGKEDRLYAFQLSEGVYKRKEVTLEGVGSQKFGELSDIDTAHAVPKLLLKDLISDFYLASLQLVLCRVAAVKRLPVHLP